MVDRIDLAEEWEYILTEITPPFKNLNKKLMKRFQQYIVDLFTKFCAELEAAGYQFFYSIDDESMENVCKTNEWEFLEDGTLFKWFIKKCDDYIPGIIFPGFFYSYSQSITILLKQFLMTKGG